MSKWSLAFVISIAEILTSIVPTSVAAQEPTLNDVTWKTSIRPLVAKYCFDCHSGDLLEADIDLGEFSSFKGLPQRADVWIKVREMLDSAQMPPMDAPQASDVEQRRLRSWVAEFLTQRAEAHDGDPGPVMLRRLSNAEYNYSVRDLTGLSFLDPTRQFPVDGAAGEGFTNTGSALVMSPSLVQKYLDAGKQIASHAALFPHGIEFVSSASRRDLTDDQLAKIRAFYFRYAQNGMEKEKRWGGTANFDTRQAGLLAIEDYLTATIEERTALTNGNATIAEIAAARSLSPVYLERLWKTLNEDSDVSASFLIAGIRDQWTTTRPGDVQALTRRIVELQSNFWKFNIVGHLGREGAPQSWMEPVTPIVTQQDFRLPLKAERGQDIVVCLAADTAGDGHDQHDFVLWRGLRLERPGKPPIPLNKVAGLYEREQELRQEFVGKSSEYLAAVSEVDGDSNVAAIAAKENLRPDMLRMWAKYLGVTSSETTVVTGHFTNKTANGTYDFVRGWGTDATPMVAANSSDQQVRVPGVSRPHGVVVHPSPAEFVAVGWQSPMSGVVTIEASLSDAHPECGNGVEWWLQHQSGNQVADLWDGEFSTGESAVMDSQTVSVSAGDVISFLVGPRRKQHSCDLTALDLTITEATGNRRVWGLGKDCSPDIQAANPHSDSYGNDGIWHFYHGSMTELAKDASPTGVVPPGSLLAKWRDNPSQRNQFATQIADLLSGPAPENDDKSTPDALLYRDLYQMEFPYDSALFKNVPLDPRFGKHPMGHRIAQDHIVVKAPASLQFRVPASLVNGCELVALGTHDDNSGTEGTTRVDAAIGNSPAIPLETPIVCTEGSVARKRVANAFADFRRLFPAALCYARIVPVDEGVTATLFYREDLVFKDLMLSAAESDELDRLWDDLIYVSAEPLKSVIALEQIREFSTQDRKELVTPWDKLKPIAAARAAAFRQRVIKSEPVHIQSVLQFADRAWRRPLHQDERKSLQKLYGELRTSELSHQDAVRLLIARVLASPAFLYRREVPGRGEEAVVVSDLELANRLSYFLWSSMPDDDLRAAAELGRLTDREGERADDELMMQAVRMLRSPQIRRMAIHFACQWLHLRDFDQNDDKNEKLYPEFAELRKDMYEETVRFFEDMFRNNGSILDVLDSDHTFLNDRLAKHYDVDSVKGKSWRRVDHIGSKGRGGVLTMATVLASQSGASRTSPILRGNWISETLLGERSPKPPADVPQLPDTLPSGLTARQLIDRHTSDPACAKCHARIDPYGFAMEQYDAIGRIRAEVADTETTLFEGPTIEGIEGLKGYLKTERRDDFLNQFCRKLLGYALGREVRLSDEPLLNRMLKELRLNDFRFHVAVESIVLSKQFREVRGRLFKP